jgi:hypothetical protein
MVPSRRVSFSSRRSAQVGSHADYCIVAGYLGKRKHWESYVKDWKHELRGRKSLHLAEMRLGSRRAKDKYGDLLKRIGNVPKRCGLKPFVGSICEQDYRHMVSGTALEVIMEGYVLSILVMLDGLVRHIPTGERLDVIFERQETYAVQRESPNQVGGHS